MSETDAEFVEHEWGYLTEGQQREARWKRLFALARRGAAMQWKVALPLEDYRRLLEAAECDDRLIWCETCGAWIDHDDPACAYTEDYVGCWKMAAGEDLRPDNCRSYRAPPPPTPAPPKGAEE